MSIIFRLIPPILLCIDMYEKEKRVHQRKNFFIESVSFLINFIFFFKGGKN